ncbi:MAG: S8 family serine peptidase [Steroidobacteraceae bacterium]
MIPSLAKFGVLLVQLAPGATPEAILPVVKAFNDSAIGSPRTIAAAGSQNSGNPIYSAGSVHNLLVNQVVVRFRRGTDPQFIASTFSALGAEVIRAPADTDRSPYLIQFPGLSGHAVRERSNRLDALDSVVYAQPNFIAIDPQRLSGGGLATINACSLKCPYPITSASGADPYFANQWHLENTGVVGRKYSDLNAEKAWEVTTGSPQVVIAILDDLVEAGHEDLEGKIESSWNSFTQNGTPSSLELKDTDVHGTAVAGLAAAVTGNPKGIAGIAPLVSIYPVRTHDPTFPWHVIAEGIKHAADHARVLSMSWTLGWPEAHNNDGVPGIVEIEEAIAYALEKKAVLVFAAGNEPGLSGRTADYPASQADVLPIIAVSATDQSDARHKRGSLSDPCGWSSNYSVDAVAAPGVDLQTTDRMGTAGYCTTGVDSNYARFDGTSAATPLVAGIVALMLSKEPGLTAQQIKTRLQETAAHPNPTCTQQNSSCRPNDGAGWGLGWGRVDACKALGGGDSCARSARPMPPGFLVVQ